MLIERKYGICTVNVSGLLSKPDMGSRLKTQILFGECVEVLNRVYNSLMKVRFLYDNSIGYVVSSHFSQFDSKTFGSYSNTHTYALEIVQNVGYEDNALTLVIGSDLCQFDGLNFYMPIGKSHYPGQVINTRDLTITRMYLDKICKRYLHCPFMLGGRTPFGIDGPGFVQMVMKLCGVKIERGKPADEYGFDVVHFVEEAQPGDLAFFHGNGQEEEHMGIVFGKNTVIHAFEKVQIDKLDHQGIYSREKKKYTHNLRIIFRVLSYVKTEAVEDQVNDESLPNNTSI